MDRRVFITGGAHGIGKSIVEVFASKGDKVAFCDIDAVLGEAVAAQTGAAFIRLMLPMLRSLKPQCSRCSKFGAISTCW